MISVADKRSNYGTVSSEVESSYGLSILPRVLIREVIRPSCCNTFTPKQFVLTRVEYPKEILYSVTSLRDSEDDSLIVDDIRDSCLPFAWMDRSASSFGLITCDQTTRRTHTTHISSSSSGISIRGDRSTHEEKSALLSELSTSSLLQPLVRYQRRGSCFLYGFIPCCKGATPTDRNVLVVTDNEGRHIGSITEIAHMCGGRSLFHVLRPDGTLEYVIRAPPFCIGGVPTQCLLTESPLWDILTCNTTRCSCCYCDICCCDCCYDMCCEEGGGLETADRWGVSLRNRGRMLPDITRDVWTSNEMMIYTPDDLAIRIGKVFSVHRKTRRSSIFSCCAEDDASVIPDGVAGHITSSSSCCCCCWPAPRLDYSSLNGVDFLSNNYFYTRHARFSDCGDTAIDFPKNIHTVGSLETLGSKLRLIGAALLIKDTVYVSRCCGC